jgi:hypothetical protein
MDKRINNDLQNTTQKTEDWTTNEIHNFIHFFLLFISFSKLLNKTVTLYIQNVRRWCMNTMYSCSK